MSGRHRSAGLTLVELLVVLAIMAILGAVAVPTFMSLMPEDNLKIGSRQVYALLGTARVDAATYHRNAAVVYTLDNFVSAEDDPENDDPLAAPLTDTVTGQFVRTITYAAIMEQIPDSALPAYAGKYMPIEGETGNFKALANEVVILLNDPYTCDPYYLSARPRAATAPSTDDPDYVNNIDALGMRIIEAYTQRFDPTDKDAAPGPSVRFLAHVFKPSGVLYTGTAAAERCTIHVALAPTAEVDDRLVDGAAAGTPNAEFRTRPIQIFRSTGRIRVAPPEE